MKENDCISRSRAIERLKLNFPISQGADDSRDRHRYMQALADIQAIREMPSVAPQEPRTGHWYIDERPESNREVICSNCEQPFFKFHKLDFDYRPKHCPNCGAKMVEPQESEG